MASESKIETPEVILVHRHKEKYSIN